MARRSGVFITGVPEIDSNLRQLEPKLARKVIVQAMRKGMKPVASRLKSNLPTGETGNLKRSVKVRARKRSRKGFGLAVMAVGPGLGGIEYGDSDQPPQMPGRRTLDATGDAARREIMHLIREGIEREASK